MGEGRRVGGEELETDEWVRCLYWYVCGGNLSPRRGWVGRRMPGRHL
jgi:hypothetical protein